MISEPQQMRTMEQSREPKGGNPLVGGNLVCDKGGISNHWGKCRVFDKWCRATAEPYGKSQIPIPHQAQK